MPKKIKTLLKDVEKRSIPFLIGDMDRRHIGLPGFQRDFVWSPLQMARLIESVIRNYPIGTFMWLPYENNKDMGVTWFDGADGARGKPRFLVIDGQQRMRTFLNLLAPPRLFNESRGISFSGKDYRFYLDINVRPERLPENPAKNSFVVFEKVTNKSDVDIETQARREIMPLCYLLNKKYIQKWFRLAFPGALTGRTRLRLKNVLRIHYHFTGNYHCPIEIISRKLSPVDHKNIFGLLNEAGTDLTTFDLLSAELHDQDFRLREMWTASRKKYPIFDHYQLDPTYLFKVMALIRQTQADAKEPSCRKKDVRNIPIAYKELPARHLREDWSAACQYTAAALQSIKNDFGAAQKKYIPYTPMILTLAAIKWWIHHQGFKEIEKGRMKKRIEKWFWISVFCNEYEMSTDTVVSRHYTGLRKWLPSRNGRARFLNTGHHDLSQRGLYKKLKNISSSSDARYKALLCMPLIGRACDIYSNEVLSNEVLHDHHIFPKKCRDVRNTISPEYLNHVANRMLITDKTNMEIKNKCPSEYLSEISRAVLFQHFLPSDIAEISYHEFHRKRLQELAERVYKLFK